MQDPRFERLPCTHQGIYADDCIVHRVQQVTTHLTSSPSRSPAGSPRQLSPAPRTKNCQALTLSGATMYQWMVDAMLRRTSY